VTGPRHAEERPAHRDPEAPLMGQPAPQQRAQPPAPAERPVAQPLAPRAAPAPAEAATAPDGEAAARGSRVAVLESATITAAGAPAAPTVAPPWDRVGPGPRDDGPGRDIRPAERLTGRMPRLHIGSHVMPHSALAHFILPAGGGGLVVGTNQRQQPVSVRFFRPEASRITVIGGAGAGQLLTLRALALGCRVAVITVEPMAWQEFARRATSSSDAVAIFPSERPFAVSASETQPVLIVYDLGRSGPAQPPVLGPWQTQLTILRQLDDAGVPAVTDSHLVAVQRLSPAEAHVAAAGMQLSAETVQLLQTMADEVAVWWGTGPDRYVWWIPTEAERACLCVPWR